MYKIALICTRKAPYQDKFIAGFEMKLYELMGSHKCETFLFETGGIEKAETEASLNQINIKNFDLVVSMGEHISLALRDMYDRCAKIKVPIIAIATEDPHRNNFFRNKNHLRGTISGVTYKK
jgi:hypothetical protein